MRDCFDELYNYFYKEMKDIYMINGLTEDEIYKLIDIEGMKKERDVWRKEQSLKYNFDSLSKRNFNMYLLFAYSRTFDLYGNNPGLIFKLDNFYRNGFFKKALNILKNINNEEDLFLYHNEMMSSMKFFEVFEKKKAEVAIEIKKEIWKKAQKYHWDIAIFSDADMRALAKLELIPSIIEFFTKDIIENNIKTKKEVKDYWKKVFGGFGKVNSFSDGNALPQNENNSSQGDVIRNVMKNFNLDLVYLLVNNKTLKDEKYYVYEGDISLSYNAIKYEKELEKEIGERNTKPSENSVGFCKIEKQGKKITCRITKLLAKDAADKLVKELNEIILCDTYGIDELFSEWKNLEEDLYPKMKREKELSTQLKDIKGNRLDIKKKKI